MVLIDVNGYKMYLKDDPGLLRYWPKRDLKRLAIEMVKNTIKPGMTVIDIGELRYYALFNETSWPFGEGLCY